MGLDQRPLADGDLDQMWHLEREAFHVDPVQKDAWIRSERSLGPGRVEGVFLDGRLVATAGVLAQGQWFGGRAVPAGGLRAVAVRVEHRRRGFAELVVRAALNAMRERGEALAALYPAVVRPYRRLGWEIAGTLFFRHVATRALAPLVTADAGVRRASAADHASVRACYARVARETNGFLDRSIDRWEWIFTRHADGFLYVAGDDGYVLYRHLDPPPAGPDGFRILVLELVATTAPALRALWGTLGAASSVVPTVVYRSGPTDPLAALLDGLDVGVGRERQWMLRLVDAAGAVAARGFADGGRIAVPLEITDEACAWNAGRRWLVVEDGHGSLEPGGTGAIRLGIGALSTLYSGWNTTAQLARTGLLTGGGAGERAALDRAFAGPLPWMLDEF